MFLDKYDLSITYWGGIFERHVQSNMALCSGLGLGSQPKLVLCFLVKLLNVDICSFVPVNLRGIRAPNRQSLMFSKFRRRKIAGKCRKPFNDGPLPVMGYFILSFPQFYTCSVLFLITLLSLPQKIGSSCPKEGSPDPGTGVNHLHGPCTFLGRCLGM